MKKTYCNSRVYKVYHQPTGREYYFEWKPTKPDLRILAEREDHDSSLEELESIDGEEPQVNFIHSDYEIQSLTFENAWKYGRKLRTQPCD
jgi:hypothetical protein